MTIQVIKLNENSSSPIRIEGHSAPVLSVLVDPLEEYFISSGCDGCVCIWNLTTGKQVKSWNSVFPSSNDIMTSKTLCRPSWKGDGNVLAIPQNNNVILYSRNHWKEETKLKTSETNKVL
jgi:chromosome transmission fidelity protein 4